jgi:hypothetical protein
MKRSLAQREWASPDDVEMFARMQQGIQAGAEPWVLISRGMHRGRRDDDGTLVGHATDEVTLRGIWSHYLKVMLANTAASGISTARARRNSENVNKRSAAHPSH